MADFKGIAEALIEGNAGRVKELVQAAVDEGVDAQKILDEGLISGMEVVGVRFKNCEIYVPEVLVSARAMHAGMEILEPILAKAGVKAKGVFVVGTVKGDLHDIGKNLVAMMLKGAGWKVVDLGVDVTPDKFVQAAIDEDADENIWLWRSVTQYNFLWEGRIKFTVEQTSEDRHNLTILFSWPMKDNIDLYLLFNDYKTDEESVRAVFFKIVYRL